MCALRWGLTLGAYNKYRHLFAEPFPKKLECGAPMSQAAYIRDALRFASENTLPGGQYYKKVKITAELDGVVIHLRNNQEQSVSEAKSFPIENVFSLMEKHRTLVVGYEFSSISTVEELNGFLHSIFLEAKVIGTHFILQDKTP